MPVPGSILIRGDILPTANIDKVSLLGTTIKFFHPDGQTTNYLYPDEASALSDFTDVGAVMNVQSIGSPIIYTIVQNVLAFASLPITVAISGVSFNASATIVVRNYTTSVALVTTFVNSTALTAAVPAATVPVGTYDVVYSDTNGAVFVVNSGLIIY